MATKDEILEVLSATLGRTANRTQLEKAAAAVAALDGDWQDVTEEFEAQIGYKLSVQCADICGLAEAALKGAELRILRKRGT